MHKPIILILLFPTLLFGIGEQILDGGNPVSISTVYETSELFEVQYIQSADTMYLTHPNHPPQVLTRTSDTSWTINDFDFQYGPFLAENTSDVTIEPNATTGTVTLTSSAPVFDANHVGALWQITHVDASQVVSDEFTEDANSATVDVQLGRRVTYSTHGKFGGIITLQRSFDDGSNWTSVGNPFTSKNDGNTTQSVVETVANSTYRLNMSGYTSGTCKYTLVASSYNVKGVAEITAFIDVNTVTAEVEEDFGDTTAVTTWSEGAWSSDEGYPSCLAFYEERLCFAGTSGSPQTIWISRTDDWENFLVGANDADALSLTIAADQVNAIRWMSSQTQLVVGTTGAEWTLSATNATEPITPTNVTAKRHSTYGSAFIQAKAVNNEIFYTQRNRKKVRNISYSFNEDNWVSPDLTILAEHVTNTGIVDWAYQRNPYPILWCVTDNGELAALTIMKEQGVIGWHVHITNGSFKSVAVIPGTSEDRVWFVTERTIDSVTSKYIEQLQPFYWGEAQEDIFFVDMGLEFDYGAAVTISGVTVADPAVMTAVLHGFSDGDQIRIVDVVGMTELNNNVYSVGTVVDVNNFQLRDSTDIVDINSVDFTAYTSGGTATQVENTFTLDHLKGESVIISADGGYYGTGTIGDSNAIVLDDFFNTTQIGMSYTSRIKPMKLASSSNSGELFSTNKRITDITLRLYDTLAVDVGDSWTSYYSVIFRDASDLLEAPPPLYSDDKVVPIDADYGLGGDIFIQSRLPLPFTLLAIKAEMEVYP